MVASAKSNATTWAIKFTFTKRAAELTDAAAYSTRAGVGNILVRAQLQDDTIIIQLHRHHVRSVAFAAADYTGSQ